MKKTISVLLAAAVTAITVSAVSAQNAAPAVAEDFKPSSLNQPGQQYPQVNSQGYARFRIVAPDAKAIRVSLGLGGQGGPWRACQQGGGKAQHEAQLAGMRPCGAPDRVA